MKLLEVGTGSGYQAAVLAETGLKVHSIEIVPELGERAAGTLASLGFHTVEVVVGDGFAGLPASAHCDRIIVTAAPPVVPRALVDRCAVGGVMVLPVFQDRRPRRPRGTRADSAVASP